VCVCTYIDYTNRFASIPFYINYVE